MILQLLLLLLTLLFIESQEANTVMIRFSTVMRNRIDTNYRSGIFLHESMKLLSQHL